MTAYDRHIVICMESPFAYNRTCDIHVHPLRPCKLTRRTGLSAYTACFSFFRRNTRVRNTEGIPLNQPLNILNLHDPDDSCLQNVFFVRILDITPCLQDASKKNFFWVSKCIIIYKLLTLKKKKKKKFPKSILLYFFFMVKKHVM